MVSFFLVCYIAIIMIGMNKMVINHLEKLFVTSDASTIIKELEVVHPAAKMVVLAAQQQETEVCFTVYCL